MAAAPGSRRTQRTGPLDRITYPQAEWGSRRPGVASSQPIMAASVGSAFWTRFSGNGYEGSDWVSPREVPASPPGRSDLDALGAEASAKADGGSTSSAVTRPRP